MLSKAIAVLSAAAVMAAGVNAYDDWDDYYWDGWDDWDDHYDDYYYDWHYGEYVSGDFYYNENSDGTVTITDYALRDATELEIPSELEGKAVTAIGDSAFNYMQELRRVVIPDSVTEIGIEAFKGCEMLAEVTLSQNIEVIPYHCFYDCASLKSIVIPDGVTSIEAGAFGECFALEEIRIPASVENIAYGTFVNCENLTVYCRRGSEAARYCDNLSDRQYINCVLEVPPAEETALVLGIVGAVWGAIVLVIIVCVVIAKKREKGDG